jgi:hypothetical protein
MAKTVSTITIDLDARITKLEAGLQGATTATRQASRQIQNEMQQSRAAIALLGNEVGVVLPRHLRNFVAELPGVSAAMSAAFSTVAVVGLGVVAFEAGKKVYDFFKKGAEAAEKLREVWGSLHDHAVLSNDELSVTNDKLEIQIAKLQGVKRPSALRLELDEARVAADKLAKSAQEAAKQIKGALENKRFDNVFRPLKGQAPMNEDKNMVGGILAEVDKVTKANQRSLRDAGADDDVAALKAHNHAAAQEKLAWALGQVNTALTARKAGIQPSDSGGATGLNLSDNVALLEDAKDRIMDQMRGVHETDRNQTDEAQKNALEKNKQARDKRVQQWTEELNELRMQREVSTLEELRFWQDKIEALTKGSDAYREVAAKVAQLAQTERRQDAETGKQATSEAARANREDSMRDMRELIQESEKDSAAREKLAATKLKGGLATAKRDAEKDTGDIDWQVRIGGMSEAQGITERLAIATAELAKEETLLNTEIARQTSFEAFDPEAATKVEQLTEELTKLRDESGLLQQKLTGEAADAEWSHTFDGILVSARNAGQQMREIFKQSVDDLNNELAGMMVGKQANFKQMFQNAGQQFAKVGLQKMEAPLMKMVGFGGKKGDSSSNPMWTKDASGATGTAPGDQQTHGILGKILGIFHLGGADGGKPDGSQSNPFYIQPAAGGGFGGESLGIPTGGGSGGGGGGAWSGLASMFGGFMADGGAMDSSSWYVAGERGPEIVSGVNGRAFSNSETSGMLGRGAGAFYNVNVPAGVSHEEFQQTMGRMLTAVHGSAVHSAVAVMQEHGRRAVAR